MEAGNNSLPESINPNHFPAKLWAMVNNPTIRAIRWDHRGEAVVIDQKLFERQILTPNSLGSSENYFKTTHFSSFVRQLNLYGFRKVELSIGDEIAADGGSFHYFYNQNFRRNRPELVASLRRLTVDNKAKLKAGVEVRCRIQNRYLHNNGANGDLKRGSAAALLCHNYQEPRMPNKIHVSTPHLMRGVIPAGIFTSPKNVVMPMTLTHYLAGAANANVMHLHQGLGAPAAAGSSSFSTHSHPYHQPGYFPAAAAGIHNGMFAPQAYLPGACPMAVGTSTSSIQEQPRRDVIQEPAKKRDVNLDAIFQIADEVMKTSNSSCLVKVETTEEAAQKNGDVMGNMMRNNKPLIVWGTSNGEIQMPKVELATQVPEPNSQEIVIGAPSDEAVEEVVTVDVS